MLEDITKQFGISFSDAKKPLQAALAEVYILDDKFVLRAREHNKSAEYRFAREQELIAVVRNLVPFSFPQLQLSINGGFFVIQHVKIWTLYPLIPGRVPCTWYELPDAKEQLTKKVIGGLKLLHENTSGKLGKNEKLFVKDIKEKIEEIQEFVSVNSISQLGQALDLVKEEEGNEQPCFVHGDWHHGNLVFDGNEIRGILDTDWCRVGNKLEDLAFTCMMLLREYFKKKFRLDSKKLGKILNYYQLEKHNKQLFNAYLLLYTAYDISVFANAHSLKKQWFYFSYQKTMLEELCAKYPKI